MLNLVLATSGRVPVLTLHKPEAAVSARADEVVIPRWELSFGESLDPLRALATERQKDASAWA